SCFSAATSRRVDANPPSFSASCTTGIRKWYQCLFMKQDVDDTGDAKNKAQRWISQHQGSPSPESPVAPFQEPFWEARADRHAAPAGPPRRAEEQHQLQQGSQSFLTSSSSAAPTVGRDDQAAKQKRKQLHSSGEQDKQNRLLRGSVPWHLLG
ncbi:unnamed protein product, partial [Amoebophrya sp. A25]